MTHSDTASDISASEVAKQMVEEEWGQTSVDDIREHTKVAMKQSRVKCNKGKRRPPVRRAAKQGKIRETKVLRVCLLA